MSALQVLIAHLLNVLERRELLRVEPFLNEIVNPAEERMALDAATKTQKADSFNSLRKCLEQMKDLTKQPSSFHREP